MAIYRTVSMAFWTDNKVADDFTPEDRYFYLYLFTNPHTNLCGCYDVSIKQMANEMGYSKECIESLINRFENVHKVLKFSKETKEVLLINWSKYNWTTSEKFRKPLLKEIEQIKNKNFKEFLVDVMENGYRIDTTCIDTTVTVTDNNSNNISSIYIIKEIIDYLNSKLNTKYQYKSKNTQKHINARLSEGRTLDDFKTVIDKKVAEWKGTEMERYLCPDTLFGTKFEKYLNQNIVERVKSDKPAYMANNPFLKHQQSDTDYDALEKELLNL